MKFTQPLLAIFFGGLLLTPLTSHAVEGEVAIGGESLFIIHATAHGSSPDQRADMVTERLPEILGDSALSASDIKVVPTQRNEFKIMVKQHLLITVTAADGKINGITSRKQAEIWAEAARRVLPMVNAHPGALLSPDAGAKMSGAEDAAATMEVEGTVTYFQRIAIPQGAMLTIKIIDVTTTDRANAVIAQKTFPITHQVPIAFTVKYDPNKIDSPHKYLLDAVVKLNGRPIWHNANSNPVLTNGNPSEMQVMLAPVGMRRRK